jgi:hypothetical protein
MIWWECVHIRIVCNAFYASIHGFSPSGHTSDALRKSNQVALTYARMVLLALPNILAGAHSEFELNYLRIIFVMLPYLLLQVPHIYNPEPIFCKASGQSVVEANRKPAERNYKYHR